MSKRQAALQLLQFSTVIVLAVGTADAQFATVPNGRLQTPLVRLPAGDFDVATSALAGPEQRQPVHVAAVPPQLNAPSAPSAVQTFDPLAPPQIEGAAEDSWAPPLPPEKTAKVKTEKPRLLERIRQRWTRGGTNPRGGNDPADQLPKIETPAGSTTVATVAPQPLSTAKRGWFMPTQTGSQKRY